MTDERYSQIYGVHSVTISQWRNDGLRAGFPCPLDTPEHMPEWWENMRAEGVFKKACSAKILAAANRMNAALATNEDEPDHSALADLDGKIMDYAESIDYAQTNLKAIKVLLDSAIKAGSEKKIVALQRSFKDAQDTLRALQRDRGKIQSEAGETLPKEEVRTALLELHANITKQFRQGIKSAFAELEEVGASREAWGIFADGLVDRICKKLTDSDFAEPEPIS